MKLKHLEATQPRFVSRTHWKSAQTAVNVPSQASKWREEPVFREGSAALMEEPAGKRMHAGGGKKNPEHCPIERRLFVDTFTKLPQEKKNQQQQPNKQPNKKNKGCITEFPSGFFCTSICMRAPLSSSSASSHPSICADDEQGSILFGGVRYKKKKRV